MQAFEHAAQSKTSVGKLPGFVSVASNRTGTFIYAKAHGPRSLKEGEESEPLNTDAMFWLASSTKLLQSIAALQCVERGQFGLDEDVTRLLPELKDIDILKGFEEGTDKPILVKATKTMTLRHLLTHSSGLAYDIFIPELQRWRASRGEVASLFAGSLVDRYRVPLMFEPGENFVYSTGLDWAGLMVARANSMNLETYYQKYIFAPVGHTDFAFHIESYPGMDSRLAPMHVRAGGQVPGFFVAANPDGAIAYSSDPIWPAQSDEAAGVGGYSTMLAFQSVLQSITVGDGKLLGKEMNDELYRPQWPEERCAYVVESLLPIQAIRQVFTPGLPAGLKINYGLGGMIMMEDIEGRRRKGSMHWGGMPNLAWWSDREAGVSGTYGSQLMPTADLRTQEMFALFEKSVYETIGGK